MLDGSVIRWFQQWSTPWLDQLFIGFSWLGEVYFYMLAIPIVYWCIDRRRGHTLTLVVLTSLWLNGLVKELVAWPRPNPGFDEIRRITEASGSGFPSGHAQGSLTLWGYLAAHFGFNRRGGIRAFGWVAFAMIVLISVSRVYTGVHYPLDTLGGWLLGLAMLTLFLVGELRRWGARWSRRTKATLAVALPLVGVLFYQDDQAFMTLGFLMGFVLGDLYGAEHTPYKERVSLGRQLAKLGIGFGGFALLYALHTLFVPPGLPSLLGYALLALWATVGAPALFVRWGLSGLPKRTHTSAGVLPDVKLPKPLVGEERPAVVAEQEPRKRTPAEEDLRIVFRTAVTLFVLVAASSLLAAATPPPAGPASPTRGLAGPPAGAASGAGEERPAVIAHRGDSINYPGNTLPAFESAAEIGVSAVELDIHLTQDGEIVVIHDDRVDRTTNGAGAIADYRLDQLKLMDAGYRFTTDGGATYPFRGEGVEIPTLVEVMETLPETTRYVIEIKDTSPGLASTLAEVLDEMDARERVLVASFDGETIRAFRELAPDVATSLSLDEGLRFVVMQRLGLWPFYRAPASTAQFPPSEYGIPIVTPGAVDVAHDVGLEMQVWTINNAVQMRRFDAMGVDAILTDDPATLNGVVERGRSAGTR